MMSPAFVTAQQEPPLNSPCQFVPGCVETLTRTPQNLALPEIMGRFADEPSAIRKARLHYAANHSAGEYARREDSGLVAHSNTVESSFSLLKRDVMGSFHHVSKKHLPRYLAEFNFRRNNRRVKGGERTVIGLRMPKASGSPTKRW